MMLLGTQAFAQVSVGAGYLNSTKSYENVDPVNNNGVYAGLSFNIPIAGGFAVAPGVYYSMIAGKKDIVSGKIANVDTKFAEHALNIPVYFNWGMNLAPDMRFFVFAGPTCQYGLASKTTVEVGSSALSDLLSSLGLSGKAEGKQEIDNYKNDNYNRFNVYVGGGVGMDIANAFQVTVGYDYGVTNLYKGDNAPKSHRSNVKLGVAYLF